MVQKVKPTRVKPVLGDKAQNPNRVPVNSNAKKFVKKPKVDFQVWSLTHFFYFSLRFVEKMISLFCQQTNDHLRILFSFVPPSKLIHVGLEPPAGLFELTKRPSRALNLAMHQIALKLN